MSITIYQIPVRVATQKLGLLRVTQIPGEVMYHPPNLLRSTQICIEVMYKRKTGGGFYTDQAAQSNFAG
jgi:hypothetical protein